jgi:hypothetical protein
MILGQAGDRSLLAWFSGVSKFNEKKYPSSTFVGGLD